MNKFILDILAANNNSDLYKLEWSIVAAEGNKEITLDECLQLKKMIRESRY